MRRWLSFLILPLLIACATSQYSGDRYGSLYNDKMARMQPRYKIIHGAGGTDLWFTFNTADLLYIRKDQASTFEAKVLISYKVFSDFRNKTLVDSASTLVKDADDEQIAKDLVGKIKLKIGEADSYIVQIIARDMHRRKEHQTVIEIDRRPHTRQHFYVSKPDSEIPSFAKSYDPGEALEIKNAQHGGKLFGRVYVRDFPLPAPPFSMYGMTSFKYGADSLFVLEPEADGTFKITLPKKGFVHLQSDTMSKKGLTLFTFPNGFPDFNTHEQMIPPLRYITSKTEFRDIQLHPNKQEAMEKFWIKCAGSKTRAKEVIRKYYTRVRSANINFTSYTEGWKTDRGLIHIIYGHPKTIYHNDDSEVWIYGEESNVNSIIFTFKKVKNPFSDNDYILERNPNLKGNWYRALDAWRSGRAYINF